MKLASWYIPHTYGYATGPAGTKVLVRNGAGQLVQVTRQMANEEEARAWAEAHALRRAKEFGAICDDDHGTDRPSQ